MKLRFGLALLVAVAALVACGGEDGNEGGGGGDENLCGHSGDPEPDGLTGMTAAHNAARCATATDTQLPPLAWSAEVAATARAYADGLAAQGCPLQHSGGPYGENIFWGTGNYQPQHVVDAWMEEESCYGGGVFPDTCSCTCGHYTQIVWRDTTDLGCGIGACPGGGEIWVCNYDPPGNWVGQDPF